MRKVVKLTLAEITLIKALFEVLRGGINYTKWQKSCVINHMVTFVRKLALQCIYGCATLLNGVWFEVSIITATHNDTTAPY